MKKEIVIVFHIYDHEKFDSLPNFKNSATYETDNPLEWGRLEYEDFNIRLLGVSSIYENEHLLKALPDWVKR